MENKELILDAVLGTSPYYSAMDHPMIKACGKFTGAPNEKWQWDKNELQKLSKNHLRIMYTVCKKSWE